VDGEQAGPAAVGVLVPPSRRTFVILRPRALEWDLLLVRDADSEAGLEMSLDEAHAAAQMLYRALREWGAGGAGGIEVVQARWELRVTVGNFRLVVCRREPGRPYRPHAFADAAAAHAAAERLTHTLCPPPGVEQEIYFNTRHFARDPQSP
jgi:hypothetical protein